MSDTITRRGFLGKLAKGSAVVAVGVTVSTEDAQAASKASGKYAGFEGGYFYFDTKVGGRKGYRTKQDLSRLTIGRQYTYEFVYSKGDNWITFVY